MAFDHSACPHCRRLREELEEAHAEIDDLKSVVVGKRGWQPPEWLGLRASSRFMLRALVNSSGVVSTDRMIIVLREATGALTREPSSPISLLKTQISHLRKDLAQYGIKITTVWGEGYMLDPESKRKAMLLGAEKERATEAAQKPQLTTEEVTL